MPGTVRVVTANHPGGTAPVAKRETLNQVIKQIGPRQKIFNFQLSSFDLGGNGPKTECVSKKVEGQAALAWSKVLDQRLSSSFRERVS